MMICSYLVWGLLQAVLVAPPRGGGVGGMLPLYWEAPPKRGMVNSGETDTRLILVVA